MVVLSNIGHIVDQQWQLLRQLKTYIFTPVWVVMPNHFHGILIINENQGIPEDEAQDYGPARVRKQDILFPFHEDVGRLPALDTLEVPERAAKT